MSVTLTVRNKDRLFAKLKQLAPAADAELGKANLAAGQEMVRLAQSFVPVATGKLRDSIAMTPPGGTPPDHSQGVDTVPPGSAMVTAGNDKVRYAHLVEFGTSPHLNAGEIPGSQNPGARRQPFFWPAYRLIRKTMKSRAGRALGKAVKRVSGT